MMVFRFHSPSQPSSAISLLLLWICAFNIIRHVDSAAAKTTHGKGCSNFSLHDVGETSLCATAVEEFVFDYEGGEHHTTKEIDIESINATLTVSYTDNGECNIMMNNQNCSACYLCADNEVAYDCANLPNGRCTVNKCERILQTAEPNSVHPNGRVQHFMLPIDLGMPLPPTECDRLHFPILEDTWTNPKLPNESMENTQRLRMSNSKRYALLKFKVTNLMDGVSQGVHSAVLRIRTVDDIPSLSVRLPEGGYSESRIAQDDWNEELLTYHFLSDKSLVDQMVDFDKRSETIATKTDLSARTWYSLDVSNAVFKNGMYTFLLKTDTPGIIVGIYGKGTEYEPELIVRPSLPYTPIGERGEYSYGPESAQPVEVPSTVPTVELSVVPTELPLASFSESPGLYEYESGVKVTMVTTPPTAEYYTPKPTNGLTMSSTAVGTSGST